MKYFLFNQDQFQFVVNKVLEIPAKNSLEIIDIFKLITVSAQLDFPNELSDMNRLKDFISTFSEKKDDNKKDNEEPEKEVA